MTPDQIEQAARRIADRINQAIADRCAGYPHMAWQAVAEQTVEARLDLERWKFVWCEALGEPPRIMITRYNPPQSFSSDLPERDATCPSCGGYVLIMKGDRDGRCFDTDCGAIVQR